LSYTQKILEKKAVRPLTSNFLTVEVDGIMFHDGSGVIASEVISENNFSIHNPNKIYAIYDHYCPSNSVITANNHKNLKEFIKKYGIKNFYGCGNGICHQIMMENHYALPGDIIAGGDSHTTTYGAAGALSTGFGATEIAAAMAMEKVWLKIPEVVKIIVTGKTGNMISGKDIALSILKKFGTEELIYKSLEIKDNTDMTMSDRMTISNMGVETGAKFTIFPPDIKTKEFITAAEYEKTKYAFNIAEKLSWKGAINLDVPEVPLVSVPHNPGNVKTINDVEGTEIDQVVIGSCTNGRIEDMRMAAEAMGKNNVKVKTIIVPASRKIYLQALNEGLIERFTKAGAMVLPSSCGPCMGAHLGLLADGERALTTTNRNFRGRMGSPKAEIYLSNPWVAGITAVTGKISY